MTKEFTVPGFRAAATKVGIRKAGDERNDLTLIVCDNIASAAGVFTQNKVRAAPVELSEKRLKSGKARAILVNAGIANAMTGRKGEKAALDTTNEVSNVLGIPASQILVAGTGVIGVQLPVKQMIQATPIIVNKLSPNGFYDAAKAILTTDTKPKIFRSDFNVGAKKATLLGMVKGAGMIAPNMATMLGFIFTDAAAEPSLLKKILRDSAQATFNRMTIDGDTSTNDTLILMAGGALGNSRLTASSKDSIKLSEAVFELCAQLTEAIARDGEGVTKIAWVSVKGASSDSDAIKAARTIADSPLVKTALHGGDPNWGRIAAAAGRSGAKVNQWKLDVTIGGNICVKSGIPSEKFDEKKTAAAMNKDVVDIEVNLGVGKGEARFLMCDLSAEYIHINAHYRT